MLQWNVKQLLASKGIEKPYTWLRKQGIAHQMAHKLGSGKQQRVDIALIDKICAAAWCTPNDLLVWQPDGQSIIDPAHPLNALKAKAMGKLSEKIKKLTPEQIAALDKMVDEL